MSKNVKNDQKWHLGSLLANFHVFGVKNVFFFVFFVTKKCSFWIQNCQKPIFCQIPYIKTQSSKPKIPKMPKVQKMQKKIKNVSKMIKNVKKCVFFSNTRFAILALPFWKNGKNENCEKNVISVGPSEPQKKKIKIFFSFFCILEK